MAAAAPPNVMAVALARFVPVIVTLVPVGPLLGVNDAIVGGGITVKFAGVRPDVFAVPPAVVTAIWPVVAPAGTTATICVAESLVSGMVAAVPPNVTAVALARFVPVMVTLVPTGPLVGVNDAIVGGGITVKFAGVRPDVFAVPPAVVTAI
jgi:hypothetical protein